jgi:hypothetical protein
MGTSSSTWKRAESSAAALFGARRRPLSGSSNRDDIDGDDAMHPRLWIESKLRASHAVWTLWRAVRSTAQKCRRAYHDGHKTPVLVLREKGKPGQLIVVHSNDLAEVCIEWLAARSGEELEAIEAAVRHRRIMTDREEI